MTPTDSTSAWSVYRRLLGYARPYKRRLIIGILAGFVAGSSVFGLLKASPGLILPFEQAGQAVQQDDPAVDAPTHGLTGSSARALEWAEARGIKVVREDGRMTWQVMVLGALGLPLLVTAVMNSRMTAVTVPMNATASASVPPHAMRARACTTPRGSRMVRMLRRAPAPPPSAS